jgi:diguanylate cyclase (GGDEF)-like protein/PAS domain S-box-containing protein
MSEEICTSSKIVEDEILKLYIKNQELLDISCDWYWEQDENLVFTYLSDKFFLITGFDKEDFLGKKICEIESFGFEDINVLNEYKDKINKRLPFHGFIYSFKDKYNRTYWFELNGVPIIDDLGIFNGYRGTGKNITNYKLLSEKVFKQEKQINYALAALKYSSHGIMICDDDIKITFVNQMFSNITGYSIDEVLGKKPNILSSGIHNPDFYKNMWNSILNTGTWKGEIWNKKKTGEIYPEHLIISTVKDDNNEIIGYIGEFSDITELKIKEEKINFLAHHDVLTGLGNRELLNVKINDLFAEARSNNKKIALFYLDLDRFKLINDTYGHSTGDILLKNVAKILKSTVRENDLIIRLGGDEFVIVIHNICDIKYVERIAIKILNSLENPIELNGGTKKINISASIGISVYPDDSTNINELLECADAAMYYAKESGRNNFQFYKEEIDARVEYRVKIENGIRRALGYDELHLFYQPIISISTNKIVGVEALLRWEDRRNNAIITPNLFIHIVEDAGMIHKLTNFVIDRCIRDIKLIQDKVDISNLYFSMNFSAKDLNEETVTKLKNKIIKENIDPTKLCIEITESMLINNIDSASNNIEKIKNSGIKIALDDFGTGYSSLHYLAKFKIDILKIDKSFVDNILISDKSQNIITMVKDLAGRMNISVTAEGVETYEQLDKLKEIGCHNYQGYLVSRPIRLEELVEFIKDNYNKTKHIL